MEYFMLAVSVVLPLFVYMLVGVLIKHLGILEEENLKAVNRMIFNIMIPLALFFSVYRVDLKSAVKPRLYVYVWVSVLVVFGLVWVFLRRCRLDGAVTATMVQGMFRSNFVLFGVTIAASLCDERGGAVGDRCSDIQYTCGDPVRDCPRREGAGWEASDWDIYESAGGCRRLGDCRRTSGDQASGACGGTAGEARGGCNAACAGGARGSAVREKYLRAQISSGGCRSGEACGNTLCYGLSGDSCRFPGK